MTVTYTNSRLDAFRFGFQFAFNNRFFLGLSVAVATFGGVWLGWSLLESHPWPTIVVTVAAFLMTFGAVILPCAALLMGTVSAVANSPGFFTEHVVKLSDGGVSEETPIGSQFVRWNGIVKLRRSRWSIQVFIAGNMAHIIPRRAFPDQESFENFFKTCSDRFAAARTAAS